MPAKESFGVGQVEIYDPELHPDATYLKGEVMVNGHVCRKGPRMRTDIVEKDPYYPDLYAVYERWLPIMMKVRTDLLSIFS